MHPSFISSETSESLTLQEWNIIFYYARGEYYTTFFSTHFSSQLFIYKNYINPIHNTKFTSVRIFFFSPNFRKC